MKKMWENITMGQTMHVSKPRSNLTEFLDVVKICKNFNPTNLWVATFGHVYAQPEN